MSAAQVLTDGFLRAAEMLALLLVTPVAASESPTLHVRLNGTVADVRVAQTVRNDGAAPINLAARLPEIDEHTDALRIHRRDRVFDLLHVDGCGNDLDEDEALHVSGHARLAPDEAIADALQLGPGETALIETVTTQPLDRIGRVYRLTIPPRAATTSRALLVDQPDAQFIVVIADRTARGTARLTLRPARGASEVIELGALSDEPIAYVIPLADRAALTALAAGAIEFEAHASNYVMWSTLPAHVRAGLSSDLVQSID